MGMTLIFNLYQYLMKHYSLTKFCWNKGDEYNFAGWSWRKPWFSFIWAVACCYFSSLIISLNRKWRLRWKPGVVAASLLQRWHIHDVNLFQISQTSQPFSQICMSVLFFCPQTANISAVFRLRAPNVAGLSLCWNAASSISSPHAASLPPAVVHGGGAIKEHLRRRSCSPDLISPQGSLNFHLI